MHWIQARKAFEQGAVGVEFHHLVGVDGVRLDLARIGDGAAGTLWVRDGERLAAILGRDDISRHGGHPVVMANPAKHILGIAVGPEAMPAHTLLSLFLNERRHMVGLIDECIQLVLPSRVFDRDDILFNCLAAGMAVTASAALRWARRLTGRLLDSASA